ncbi:unknown [Cryptobacterium sp. CAG:338]|nr:unknown [Cryptobacterium sp. CAG:338]
MKKDIEMEKDVEKEIDQKIAEVFLRLVMESDPIHTITYGEVSNEVARLFNVPRPYPITF